MIIFAVLLVIVAAGAFYGGIKYQSSKVVAGGQLIARGARGGLNGRTGGANGANRPIDGQIVGMDSNSITVKLSDGSSKIVLTNSSTKISKTDTAALTDLKTGDTVGVFGTTNSDGSVTAQNIQLNPQFRIGQGQAAPSGSGQ